jgi:hypothetical protein
MRLTEAQKIEFLEMEIRGRFLMMACDIEWTMLMIMTHCAPNPLEQRDFKDMRMHNKIECTIADLKRHKTTCILNTSKTYLNYGTLKHSEIRSLIGAWILPQTLKHSNFCM